MRVQASGFFSFCRWEQYTAGGWYKYLRIFERRTEVNLSNFCFWLHACNPSFHCSVDVQTSTQVKLTRKRHAPAWFKAVADRLTVTFSCFLVETDSFVRLLTDGLHWAPERARNLLKPTLRTSRRGHG